MEGSVGMKERAVLRSKGRRRRRIVIRRERRVPDLRKNIVGETKESQENLADIVQRAHFEFTAEYICGKSVVRNWSLVRMWSPGGWWSGTGLTARWSRPFGEQELVSPLNGQSVV